MSSSKKIAVFTGTRAEYGLLYWLMKEIQQHPRFELQTIVGAMHLSPEFGETWHAVANDGFAIDAKVEMLLSSNSAVGVVKSMGLGTIGFADALERLQPDLLVVLGDRFEALAITQAALILQIPVAHLHGGEITEGAYDDALRHAITKMADLHFVATEAYRQRVIQMGEQPDRVHTVGAMGLDNLSRSPRMSRQALCANLGLNPEQPYFLVTYHPVTAMNEPAAASFEALLWALDQFPDRQVVITYPNADNGGRPLIAMIEAYAQRQPGRVVALPSLGTARYISALANAHAVVGNSSSGIIEAPSLHVPTVNIGVRQQGRLCAHSVLHCDAQPEAIRAALQRADSEAFHQQCQSFTNPYYKSDAAMAVIRGLEQALNNDQLSQPAAFYDLPQ